MAAAAADELETCRAHLIKGDYEESLRFAAEAMEADRFDEAWPLLKIRAELALGRYDDALKTVEGALAGFSWSIRVRLAGHEVYRLNGQADRAALMLEQINGLASRLPWRYSDPPNQIALGRAALRMGADPRQVLELFYDRTRTAHPEHRETYLASGELALRKHDNALAKEFFEAGTQRFPDDPDMLFGLARVLAGSGGEGTDAVLARALELNPRHIPALLFHADHLIDAEHDDEAAERIDRVLATNPVHPTAWALRAVLAHLRNDTTAAETARSKALEPWADNPEVDHVIGRKLSQKYRFAEGAEHQRPALVFDPDHLAAKKQLAQDLLRLGEVEEGWRLARQVHETDAYDVVAYNLVTLQENIARFRTIEEDGFILRMEAKEADLYGRQVLDLLREAKRVLCEKYGMTLTGPVTVEIFPDQSDFAIRTFGLPGGAGFLGVCFGKVITANSPASQPTSNWQAVLWHEFCHVVTLQATRNRMPRWLSEGISVYEEVQRDPTWGQAMTPAYRRMVLGGELTPVGELSAAFLRPRSPLHLQFAYYQSLLVVEHIIESSGLQAMRRILADLAEGAPINETLARHVAPLEELEATFKAFALERADALGRGATWEPPLPDAVAADPDALSAWLTEHPDHYPALAAKAGHFVNSGAWDEARGTLERMIELYPGGAGPEGPYARLAVIHRRLGRPVEERRVLEQWAERDGAAVEAYLRLMELAADDEDWPAVVTHADRMLAVNPLVPPPHRHLARACEALDEPDLAIEAYRAVLRLDPPDPAGAHFALARLLHDKGDPHARRQVLMALEEAPRFRAAQRLLLSIVEEDQP